MKKSDPCRRVPRFGSRHVPCEIACVLKVKPRLAPKGNPRARSAYVLSAYPGEEAVAAGTVIANVHSEGVTSPTPRSVEDNTRTMLRILLVEDHPHLAEELRTTLEELVDAHIVATAAAEADACAWMDGRTNGCDVAIINIFLRKGSGLGVLKHMARYERPPQRVVLTNYATLDMRSRCRALGADAVFDKSTEVDELIDWLDMTNVRH